MVFNATFNNISVIWWQLVLLAEETEYQEKCIIRKYYDKVVRLINYFNI